MIVRKENQIILQELYELFYWQEPDYNNNQIDEQFHCMMRILEHYQIYLSKFGFSINATVEHNPFNHDIQDYIDKLKKEPNNQEYDLRKLTIMKIQLISIALHKKATEEKIDYFDLVKAVSIIIHVNEQVLPHKTGKEISKLNYINNSIEEIDNILTLIKQIDNDIEKYRKNVE